MILATSRISHPGHLSYVARLSRYAEAELVLLCGDVGINEEFLTGVSQHTVLAVSGDEDDIHVIKLAKRYGILIDGRVVEVSGVKVGGVGAINTALDYSTLVSGVERIDILVTHFPPHGCLDAQPPFYIHSGLRSIRQLLEAVKPSVVLVGHSTKPTVNYCGGIPVVGASSYIVLLDSARPRRVRFIPLDRYLP